MDNNLTKITTVLFSFLLTVLFSCAVPEKEELVEWKTIFDGKTLEGWTPKFTGQDLGVNYKNTFKVVDSVLSVDYSEYDSFRFEFGHLFYREKLSYYRVRMDYRFVGEAIPGSPDWAYANNGLMLHSQSPESMKPNQGFPLSIEYQLLAERPTGSLCTPGCHVTIIGELYEPHCLEDYEGPIYELGEWVTAEAVVLGDSLIHHIMNGDTLVTYSKPVVGGSMANQDTVKFPNGMRMTEGYLAVQAESFATEFRNIELLNLCGCMDKAAKNYKGYYLKSDPKSCLY